MKRKVKKHYWGWIIAVGTTLLVLVMPVDLYISFILQTKQKVEVTEQLITDLTLAVEAGYALLAGIAALIFYKVVKK